MDYNIDDLMSELTNQEENDRHESPTFVLPNFEGEGTMVFYKDAWLFKILFPSKKILKALEGFQFKDDIVVASFPKSGLRD